MDTTIYDQDEVIRLRARPDCHGAKMRFAIHVAKVAPTHIWPHMFFAAFSVDVDERYSHYEAAVRAGNAQLDAERDGRATRRRDVGEDAMFKKALYRFAFLSAHLGEPADAARAVAQLLAIDPASRVKALEMAKRKGVFPAHDTETAFAMTM